MEEPALLLHNRSELPRCPCLSYENWTDLSLALDKIQEELSSKAVNREEVKQN